MDIRKNEIIGIISELIAGTFYLLIIFAAAVMIMR